MQTYTKLGKTVVLALGGSILFPDTIDWQFLKTFRSFIRRHTAQGRRFIIATGGGKLARLYQDAAGRVHAVSNEDKDWLGIHATRANAHLLRTVLADIADPVVIVERKKIAKLKYPVTVASGWRPGWSTDYIATVLAHDFGAGTAIIAGKPSHVYSKDFVKYPNAVPFEKLSWPEYQKLIPAKWTPGFSSPVDLVAAQFCKGKGIDCIVLDGRSLSNLAKLLSGKKFTGTVVSR